MADVFLRQGEATPADVRLRAGIAYISGISSGDQAAQAGDGAGTVYVAPAVSVVPEHLWGEWIDVRELLLKKARELPPKEAPAPISGQGDGEQAPQTGSGTGHVMPRIAGASNGSQARQVGRSFGRVSMKAKNERELLEILLLEAA